MINHPVINHHLPILSLSACHIPFCSERTVEIFAPPTGRSGCLEILENAMAVGIIGGSKKKNGDPKTALVGGLMVA